MLLTLFEVSNNPCNRILETGFVDLPAAATSVAKLFLGLRVIECKNTNLFASCDAIVIALAHPRIIFNLIKHLKQ